MKALNPEAPEFSPAITQKANLQYTLPLPGAPAFSPAFPPPPPPPRHIFYFNNPFPYHTKQTYKLPLYKPCKALTDGNIKPVKPFRWGACNRKCIPPRLSKSKLWVHRNRNFSSPKRVPLPVDKLAGKTSVMVKNIPNCFSRIDLLKILDSHCRKENKESDEQEHNRSSYDFLYLPMDFVKHANLGYAFVNFTSSVAAEKFRREFDKYFWGNFGNKKVCEITAAKFQGKEELSQHFKNSRFTCHTDHYLPVVLSPPSDGLRAYTLMTLGDRVGLRGRALGRSLGDRVGLRGRSLGR